MTSVLYDIIGLEAVRGGSNAPIEGLFDGLGEMCTPKCCRPSCGSQKGTSLRHNAYFQPLWVKTHPRITLVGESGKKIKIQTRVYISRIWSGSPLRPRSTNFGLPVRFVDVINCAKFYRNRLRGLDSVRGRSFTIFIGLRCPSSRDPIAHYKSNRKSVMKSWLHMFPPYFYFRASINLVFLCHRNKLRLGLSDPPFSRRGSIFPKSSKTTITSCLPAQLGSRLEGQDSLS